MKGLRRVLEPIGLDWKNKRVRCKKTFENRLRVNWSKIDSSKEPRKARMNEDAWHLSAYCTSAIMIRRIYFRWRLQFTGRDMINNKNMMDSFDVFRFININSFVSDFLFLRSACSYVLKYEFSNNQFPNLHSMNFPREKLHVDGAMKRLCLGFSWLIAKVDDLKTFCLCIWNFLEQTHFWHLFTKRSLEYCTLEC